MNKFLILFIAAGLFVPVLFASAMTGTIDPANKYAWGENIGWINFGCDDCDVQVTDSLITGYAWSQDYGWINLSPTTYGGVHNNGHGTLSGYAWGENLGWINFSGVSINSLGQFIGTATGDITGSVNFDCIETGCPVTTDWRAVGQFLTFNISNYSVGFGAFSPLTTRYATSSPGGSSSDSADALTLSVATNASSGYTLTVDGSTLTSGASTISAIGGTATAAIRGTEQFGIRVIKNSGTGSASAPYNELAPVKWALDTAAFPDEIASGSGDSATTVFGVRYICNISPVTKPGNYSANLIFNVVANF